MLIVKQTGVVFLIDDLEPQFWHSVLHPHSVHTKPLVPKLTAQPLTGVEKPLEIKCVKLSNKFEVGSCGACVKKCALE